SVTNRYTMRVTVPKRTGHHVLYAAWQRSDSTEAFYSCSDVSFGGTTATTPTTNPTPPVAPTTLSPLGQVVAQQDLPANASVKLRVFGAQGADLEAISLSVTAANGARANWLSQLATLVNSSSAYVRLGNAVGNTVSVPTNVNSMQLYALAGQNGLNFAVDIALPTAPVTTPVTTPPATPTKPPVAAGSGWVEGGSYKVDQVVSYKGVNYVCLQAHTAWRGAGWYPDVAGVLDILWKRV
ncbi:MAG: lytic polysaccharide monooxygenase, partial [Burkholderiales bacterium]|nr:lytic polysaccharide monooxygenase [Burkholderiales bacterium]